MFGDTAKLIMSALIEAEDKGKPRTREQCARWMSDSTWDDLWQQGHINIKGQEHALFTVAGPKSEFVASAAGRTCYEQSKKSKHTPVS